MTTQTLAEVISKNNLQTQNDTLQQEQQQATELVKKHSKDTLQTMLRDTKDKILNIKKTIIKNTTLTSDLLSRANSIDMINNMINSYSIDNKFVADKPYTKWLIKLFSNFGNEDFFYTKWTDGYKVMAVGYYQHLLEKSTDENANKYYKEQLAHYQKYNQSGILWIDGKNRALNITEKELDVIKNDIKNIILENLNNIDEYFTEEVLKIDELVNMDTLKNGWYGSSSEKKVQYLFKSIKDYNVEILRDYFNVNDSKLLIDKIREYCDHRIQFINDLRILIELLF